MQKVNSAKNLGPNSKLSPEVKSALQKVADIIEKQGEIFGNKSKIDDLIKLAKDPSQIDRLEKLKSKGYTFILGNPQAVTAIEKSLGLKPKNNDSLLADKTKSTSKPKTEKPAKEKPESTGKKGRPAGSGKKKAVRTPGDDGFDDVSYSDVEDEDVFDTETAPAGDKEVEKAARNRDELIKQYKTEVEPELKDKIAKAKSGDTEAMSWLKSKQDIIKKYNQAKQVNV